MARQNEDSPIAPITPYGVSKAAAHASVVFGRESMSSPMSNVIFYNGESERRPPRYVFRKITRGLAEISLGRREMLSLGNTSVIRDFMHASDLASGMVQVATNAKAGDYICASGEGNAVAKIVTEACGILGLDPTAVIRTDPAFFRPNDIPSLIGNASKLRALGWKPQFTFQELVKKMVEFDLSELKNGANAGTT